MMSRPHVIWLISDEHRGQAMGHAGDPNVHTPCMDAMAVRGASFGRAYANCPICTPSRGTIFSGRHAHAGPVAGFFDVYKPSAPSMATMLRQAGYHTAYFGKWHCGIVHDQVPAVVRTDPRFKGGVRNRTPEHLRAGFQDWFGFENLNQHFASSYYFNSDLKPTALEGYETDGFTDLVLHYLSEYGRNEPLFLDLSVTPPHFPLDVPERWLEKYEAATLKLRPNCADIPEYRDDLAHYYAMIENLDWNVGRLRDALKRTPGFDNTLLVYTSDHGDFLGSHGRSCRKEYPLEEGVRVPAIFEGPGVSAVPGGLPGLFSLVDLVPTTLGLLGLPVPSHVQGTDFPPALRGQPFAGPEAVLLEMVGNPRWNLDFVDWRGMVTQRWKYAFYEDRREELFDLESDPYEQRNLAQSQPKQAAAMRQQLLGLLAKSREPYFDVIMTDGVPAEGPVLDASDPARRERFPGISKK
jgi:arylsulfatase A-like enzyme